jgi:hypothetical protein
MACATLGVLGVLYLSLLTALPAAAQGRPPGGNVSNPAIRAADIAEPAVVRLATLYQGSITFELCGRANTLPSGGQPLTVGGLGTGTFVSASGDILTADHVVNIDKTSLDAAVIQALATEIANMLNANASCLNLGGVVTPDQISYQTIVDAGIPFSTTYAAPQFVAWLNTTYTGPDTSGATDATDPLKALLQAPHMAATLEGYSQFTDNDLAVLHVKMTDTPSVPLGNLSDVAVQDHLTEIGFPGNGDASHPDSTYDSTGLVTPTVDGLDVVAIKASDNGASLLQVSGALEHGDSGGPALDVNGNIAGIVSYSATDDPIGSFFLRSSDSARQLLESTGINTTPGTFETLWKQAFTDYASTDSGHWHTAASELDALSEQYPNFRGILPYKAFADQAESTEVTFGAGESGFVALVALVVALVALLALVIVLLMNRSRRRRRQSPVVAAPAPTGSYNPYNGYIGYNPYGPYNPYNGYGGYPPPPAGQGLYYGSPAPVSAGGAVSQNNHALDSVQPGGTSAVGARSADHADDGASHQSGVGGETGWSAPRPAIWQDTCRNGHAMTPDETYCSVCGLPRAPHGSSSSVPSMQWPGRDSN